MIVKVLQNNDDKLWAGLNSKIKHVCGDETLFYTTLFGHSQGGLPVQRSILTFWANEKTEYREIGGCHLAFSPSLLYRGEGRTASIVKCVTATS